MARPQTPGVASLVVEIDGSGIFAGSDRSVVIPGPSLAGSVAMRDFALMPEGLGAGSVQFVVNALDDSGQVIATRRTEIYAEADADGRVFGSLASADDVALRRLEADLAAGVITPEEAAARARRLSSRMARTTGFDEVPDLGNSEDFVSIQAVGTFTVKGQAQWLDRAGQLNPIPRARVDIFELNIATIDVVSTAFTDDAGFYSITFTHEDEPNQGNPDLFVVVSSVSQFAVVKAGGSLGQPYEIVSPVTTEIAPGSTITRNLTSDTIDSDANAAFSVHASLVNVGRYLSTILGTVPSTLDTIYPSGATTSFFSPVTKTLNIIKDDRWDWDVIAHEFGHYLTSVNGFDDSTGGKHIYTANLSEVNGSKSKGLPLAFNEGWVTHFAVSALRSIGASVVSDPTIGDQSYDDTIDQNAQFDLEQVGGFGEDNELSVMATLWDLWDSEQDGGDVTSISDKVLFELFKSLNFATIGGVWDALMAKFPNIQDQVKIAAIFKRHAIAPEPLSPADNTHLSPDANVSFSWGANGGGPLYRNNLFNLRFFDVNWNEVYRVEGLTANSYTLSPLDKLTLSNYGQGLYWAVEGKNTAGPATPGAASYYLSPARSFVFNLTPDIPPVAFVIDTTVSMNEEAKAIGNVMASIAGQYLLLPEDQRPLMNLVTFTDEVRPGFLTNDISKIVEILNSFDSGQGGGPCPENAIGGINAGMAWLRPGSKMYIATDASVNGDIEMAEIIAAVISAGIEVYVILDGDCEGLDAPLSGGQGSQSLLTLGDGDLDEDCGCNGHDDETGDDSPGGMIEPMSTKPPGDEPPRGFIDDPGQPAPDDHGDTVETATRLVRGGERVRGFTTAGVLDTDLFRVHLVAGKQNRIFFRSESGNIQRIFLLAPDGTSVLFGRNEAEYDIDYTPAETGDYFFRVEYSGTQAGSEYYTVRLAGDGLYDASRSAVAFFSQLAAETGGMFTLPTNTGALLDHKTALRENIGRTMLGVPVVWAETQFTLPIGQDTAILLHGHDTNWAEGRTTLEFLEGDIQVKALTVLGPDRILVVLNPLPGARQKMRDVRVVTIVGDKAEVALGSKVVTIVNPAFPTTNPRNYAVTPEVLRPGQTQRLQVWGNFRGVSASLPIVFGPDITVLSKTLVSETMIELEVAVAPDADTGYRRLTVEGFVAPINSVSLDRAVYVTRQAEVPRVTAISPNLSSRDEVREVELKIANFTLDPATASADFGPGITVESFTVVDPTTARARIRIAADAPLGRRRVDIRSGERTGTLIDGFTVDPGNVPLIDSILPISADLGRTLSVTLRVRGLTLAPGATATFGDGITVESLDVIDPTTAIARVSVAPGTNLGGRDVSVMSGGVTALVRGAFQVDAAPEAFGVHEIVSVSPASAAPGTTFDLTINGAFTRFSQAGSTFEFFLGIPGITVESFTVVDPLTAVARITIAPGVSPRVGNLRITSTVGDWQPPLVVNFPFQIAQAEAARIDSVSPRQGIRGQDVTVRVEVANIDLTGTTPSSYGFQGLGVSVVAVNLLSPTVAELNVRIQPTAVLPSAMGNALRTLRIAVGSNAYNYANAFFVLDDPSVRPNIRSVSPAVAQPGDALTVLVDVGTMTLASNASALFGPGVAVESFEIVDPDTARVQVRVAGDAALGPRDLRVTSGSATATRLTAFNVVAAARSVSPPLPSPAITSIDPSSARQGDTVMVTVNVQNLTLDASATADFGPGLTVQSIEIVNPSTARVRLLVDSAAELGTRQVRITSQGSAASLANAFTVLAKATQSPAIVSISPSAGSQGQKVNVTIRAENLPLGTDTTVDFGEFVKVIHLDVINENLLIAQIEVDPFAPLGIRTVTVRSGGLAASQPGGFEVNRSVVGTPVIQSVSPASADVGKIVDVEVEARDTGFAEGLTTADFGPGIQVNVVTVLSPSRATVRITIAPNATPGPRTIRLTTGAEVVESASFSVIALPADMLAPTITGIERFGIHARPTAIDLIFSEPLDPIRAGNLSLYTLLAAGRDGKLGTADDRILALRSLGYDAATGRVTLRPARPLPLRQSYLIIVDAGPEGLRDVAGNPLDGDRNGTPGGHAVVRFGDEALRIPTRNGLQPLPRYRNADVLPRATIKDARKAKDIPRLSATGGVKLRLASLNGGNADKTRDA